MNLFTSIDGYFGGLVSTLDPRHPTASEAACCQKDQCSMTQHLPITPLGRRAIPGGLTRRELLWESGCGFAGTALTGLLAADGFFAQPAVAASLSKGTQPLA